MGPFSVDNTTADINNMDIVFEDNVILQGIGQDILQKQSR